ncbi:efflux RND transporter periplasmic adaptor subunit [Rubritalea spongiae]|uniref:Efflux RND transporter periplasmic adaptor subunit n=1 Tax=Rubritalea spongiae TaxID=430797 RepID=A0ABW5E3X2_9BACT
MKSLLRIIPAILILAVGIWGWNHFVSNKDADAEEPQQKKLSKEELKEKKLKNAQQTNVLRLKSKDFPILLESHGIVQPPSITSLTPQVSGIITKISPHFENGSFIEAGEVLLELDPSDFQSQISSAQAALARAEAVLVQEKARAAQALRNWQDIGFDDKPNDLVLRKPQLKEAEASVAAQKAELERAQRNLERTKIKAPYTGRVRSRDIGLGQTVGTGTKLGEVYATSYAEVRLPLSIRQLSQIDINEIDFDHIQVELKDAINPDNDSHWSAKIVRIEGELDPNSRELFVVARVEDPFGMMQKDRKVPLRMNQPVTAFIEANTLKNVVEIPRSALYGKDEIIIIKDNLIHRQTINIVWSTLESVITDNHELDQALLSTTKLPYAPEGSPVRIIEPTVTLTKSP